jgi:hypothetical protein
MLDFKLVRIFEDDHELCCIFEYKNQRFSLWWSTVKYVAAFQYTDSPTAQEILTKIAEVLDTMIERGPELDADDENDYRHTDYGYLDYGWM